MFGTIATRLTGAKSFTASHGSLRYRLGLMPCVPAVTINSVWPSAVALAATSVPMLPLTPGRFSMITGWPNDSLIFCPTTRARMSVAPAGV
jgi:hypothetical protein